jgi:two-component system, OmpR family, phosphate regulon sensor histidine kinase PhoR
MMWVVILILSAAALVILQVTWKKRLFVVQNEAAKKIAELERQQHLFAAHASAEKEALFNSMVEGVLVLDPDGRVRLANRALENLFALSDGFVGKTVLEALRIHELGLILNRLAKEGKVIGAELILPGLEQRIFEVNAASIFDREGQQKGVILVFHEVTRIKKLEKTRQEFVANVSHELRTPLALIKGYVETLIDGAKDVPETQDRFLNSIERNANRLALIIEDLLTISRLESGKIVLKYSKIDLHVAVMRTIEDFYPRSTQKNVRMVNAVPKGLIALADADRLNQVFSNLIDNAIKYGRNDGLVTVKARLTEGKIEMAVHDDGPGIPPDSLARVFERFYRVDKARSRDQGGTGLGLAIVKHIVQSHGGKVWAVSQPGLGSAFFFTLDVAPEG